MYDLSLYIKLFLNGLYYYHFNNKKEEYFVIKPRTTQVSSIVGNMMLFWTFPYGCHLVKLDSKQDSVFLLASFYPYHIT